MFYLSYHFRRGPPVVVHLGSVELYSSNATSIAVESVTNHPGYSPPSCYNDIGLVKLSEAPVFTKSLRPACLPTVKTRAQIPGAVTIATGWGKLGFGKVLPISHRY